MLRKDFFFTKVRELPRPHGWGILTARWGFPASSRKLTIHAFREGNV